MNHGEKLPDVKEMIRIIEYSSHSKFVVDIRIAMHHSQRVAFDLLDK